MSDSPLRRLPAVQALLAHPKLAEIADKKGRETVVAGIRETIDAARQTLIAGETVDLSIESLSQVTIQRLARQLPGLRPVINATGILLHTGLGRAPLAPEAAQAVDRVVRGYCNLEFDLETGERGHRTSSVSHLLQRLTGAEAATVVNNNAAATILALRAVASGREVLVSRGELVEIGGSFRLPEIFEVSGARLREVGTTNKTRLADYERAIGPDTAAIMRVHPSNYRIVGFTESVAIADLARLGHEHGLTVIDDIGSGVINAGGPPGITGEPMVVDGMLAGADLILFSGDKLLGGPQCGLIVGRSKTVKRLETDPLMRGLRVDKMTLAALEATLQLAIDPSHAATRIPLWKFLATPLASLRERAESLADTMRRSLHLQADAFETIAHVGGGSVPIEPIPSWGIALEASTAVGSLSTLARRLRLGDPALVSRIHGDRMIFDLRAVDPEEDDKIWRALAAAVALEREGR